MGATRPFLYSVVDLDEAGRILDPETARPTPEAILTRRLATLLPVPATASDIFVFVHGWRNSPSRALGSLRRLYKLLDAEYWADLEVWRDLGPFNPYYVLVRWPSMSSPLPNGYREIRDRSHRMTTHGYGEYPLAHLLGYLNDERGTPGPPRVSLKTHRGQYLHCVSHSFGGRFICEAAMVAHEPKPPSLAVNRYPYLVDTMLILQMATNPNDFAGRYASLLRESCVGGPIALTYSKWDRALALWHRVIEGVEGLGAVGASAPTEAIFGLPLPGRGRCDIPEEARRGLLNVDASWRIREGRYTRPEGAHSDIWHPEIARLLLSLVLLARS